MHRLRLLGRWELLRTLREQLAYDNVANASANFTNAFAIVANASANEQSAVFIVSQDSRRGGHDPQLKTGMLARIRR
jgi:hypothetical protein